MDKDQLFEEHHSLNIAPSSPVKRYVVTPETHDLTFKSREQIYKNDIDKLGVPISSYSLENLLVVSIATICLTSHL